MTRVASPRQTAHSPAPVPGATGKGLAWRPRRSRSSVRHRSGSEIGAREGAGPRPQTGGARREEAARPHPAPAPGASPRSPRPGRRRPAQRLARAARRDALPPPPTTRRPFSAPVPAACGEKVTTSWPASPGRV